MSRSRGEPTTPTLRRRRRREVFVGVAAGVFLLLALGGARTTAPRRRALVVFAAASLNDAFRSLARRFEREHPDVDVVMSTAGSQELRAQIEHGALVDVFASADRRHMDALAAKGLVLAPAVFACTEPVVVVRPALAHAITTFAELSRAARIVVGAPEVPIGAYTRQIFQRAAAKLGSEFEARVAAKTVSGELNVRQVLAKVVLGEADAGIVYRADAVAAGDKVRVVEIPSEVNVTVEYAIATLSAARSADLARRWEDLVRSAEGLAVLREAGFVPCPPR